MSSEVSRIREQLILQKVFGMDALPAAPNLSPEIVPVMEINNVAPEIRFLGGERLGIGTGAIGATAGNLAAVSFFNPASSGQLTILERIEVTTDVAGVITLRIGHTAGGGAGTVTFRDTRLLSFSGSNRGASSILVEAVAAVGGTTVGQWIVAAGQKLDIVQPFVLGPNNAANQSILTIAHSVITTPTIRTVWYFRESNLFPIEQVQG